MQLPSTFAFRVDQNSVEGAFGLFLLLAALAASLFYLYRRSRLYFAAQKWTLAEATIQGGYAAYLQNSSRASKYYGWRPTLQYSYQVAGEYYSGYLLFGGGYFNSSDDARAATEKWLNQKITIRYNPENPQESAFLKQDGAPSGWRSMSNQAPPTTDLITLPPLK